MTSNGPSMTARDAAVLANDIGYRLAALNSGAIAEPEQHAHIRESLVLSRELTTAVGRIATAIYAAQGAESHAARVESAQGEGLASRRDVIVTAQRHVFNRASDPAHHMVAVDVDPESGSVTSLEMKCTAPPDAPCRTYPDCECEAFSDAGHPGVDDAGHQFEVGRSCWVRDWFAATPLGEGLEYVGDDAGGIGDPTISRKGHVDVGFEDGYPIWRWSE